MGQIVGPDRLISLHAANVGDLVVFSDGNVRGLGLIIEAEKGAKPLLGVLSDSSGIPHLRGDFGDQLCMSYGNNWLIEPIDLNTAGPSYFETNRRAGLLVLTNNGWFMNFSISSVDQFGRFNFEWRNLKTSEKSTRIEMGVLFHEWNLWSNFADRDHKDGRPLLSYKAKVQKGNQS